MGKMHINHNAKSMRGPARLDPVSIIKEESCPDYSKEEVNLEIENAVTCIASLVKQLNASKEKHKKLLFTLKISLVANLILSLIAIFWH